TKVLDVATGKEIALLPASTVMAISADATVLAEKASRDEFALWDLRAGRKVTTIQVPQVSDGTQWVNLSPDERMLLPRVILSPDGKMLAAFCRWRDDDTVTLWDVASRQSRVLKPPPPESNRLMVRCAEFSTDGKLLAVGYKFQWVTVWDVATGT